MSKAECLMVERIKHEQREYLSGFHSAAMWCSGELPSLTVNAKEAFKDMARHRGLSRSPHLSKLIREWHRGYSDGYATAFGF